jgi:hypothetical protein
MIDDECPSRCGRASRVKKLLELLIYITYIIIMESLHNAYADPFHALPREVFAHVILTLRAALPRPLTESEEDGALRDRAAMAAVAALLPENAVEGRLAAQFVAADAWAMDCLQLAYERQREPRIAERCRAQAMGMMREGKSALKALEKLQAARRALAKDEAAAERAAWVEHADLGRMAEGLGQAVTAADMRKFGHVSGGAESFAETRFETDSMTTATSVREAPSKRGFGEVSNGGL